MKLKNKGSFVFHLLSLEIQMKKKKALSASTVTLFILIY